MIDIDFSTDIPIKIDTLFQILTDYTKLKELVPDQVKECKILQKTNEETITEELLTFNTYLKHHLSNLPLLNIYLEPCTPKPIVVTFTSSPKKIFSSWLDFINCRRSAPNCRIKFSLFDRNHHLTSLPK